MAICEWCSGKDGVKILGGRVENQAGIHLCSVCRTGYSNSGTSSDESYLSILDIGYTPQAAMHWLIPRLLD